MRKQGKRLLIDMLRHLRMLETKFKSSFGTLIIFPYRYVHSPYYPAQVCTE